MDAQPRPESTLANSAVARGSTWAELDEAFFRLVQDVFTHEFCAGASALLASNDSDAADAFEVAADDAEIVIQLPDGPLSHERALERINQEIERELALRRSMRHHPSRRRF